MTITISPEIEKVLTEESSRRGTTPEILMNEALRSRFATPVGSVSPVGEKLHAQVNAAQNSVNLESLSPEERENRRLEALALIRSGYFAQRLCSSEEFVARKQEEKALEERRWHS